MSTVQVENTTAQAEQVFKKTYEIYNDNFELVSKEVTVKFTPAATYEEAASRLNNDPTKLLEGANGVLRREAFKTARQNAGVGTGINRGVLMEFIKPYRELPQFASLISSSDKRKATAAEWDNQTNKILEQIKNVPFIVDAIKAKSAQEDSDE